MDKSTVSCYTLQAPRSMNGRVPSLVGYVLAGALLAAGCSYPKYATYTSLNKDYKCGVPYVWNVKTDQEGTDFTNATFIGPFEKDFYLGVPTLSVRWYGNYKPHRLTDGMLEMYSGPDDFISQTLNNVYGPEPVFHKDHEQDPDIDEILVGGRKAKHFVVVSPSRVPKDRHYGVSVEVRSGDLVNLRQHAYVVVPMDSGFYVLVYPATRQGYKLYEKEFNFLVHSFTPLKDGPAGRALEAAAKKGT